MATPIVKPITVRKAWVVEGGSLQQPLVVNNEDLEEVQGLCAALVRQNWHQRKLLGQAVSRIADMDAQLACLE